MDISQEYLVEVSPDKQHWDTVLDFRINGRFHEIRPVELTEYYKESPVVYLKVSDGVKTDGWGGRIDRVKFVSVTGSSEQGSLKKDISSGWQANNKDYTAGELLKSPAGSPFVFTKEIEVPSYMHEYDIAISFSFIESGSAVKVYINGAETEPVAVCGKNLTIPLPRKCNGKKLNVRVETTATNEGKAGLWNSVRLGFHDLVTIPEKSWQIGNETRLIHRNYFKEGEKDLVKLNALAGNFLSYLYDSRYGLNCFNGMMRWRELFYVHDSSRGIIAFADEERYSPIVRLDAIKDLYNGVLKAKVPGSDYEIFLKKDKRGKQIRRSPDKNLYRWFTNQDIAEPFMDMTIKTNGKAYCDINCPAGDTDIPTTVKVNVKNTNSFSLLFNNFMSFHKCELGIIRTENDIVADANQRKTEIMIPDGKYFLLHTRQWHSGGIVFTWDKTPNKILATYDHNWDKSSMKFTALEFVYDDASVVPVISAVPFVEFDLNCRWPLSAGKNIVKNGTYGANGYDPTYICGNEGLGTGAFAAAAYIFAKYNDPLAESAEQLAVKAMEAACEAAQRGSIPVIKNDRIIACDYLIKLGHNKYMETAKFWADYVLKLQLSDGSFPWSNIDGRFVLSLQRTYDLTVETIYKEAIDRYKSSIEYFEDKMLYKGAVHAGHPLFLGGVELAFLGHDNDTENLNKVFIMFKNCMDDTGVFDCSDINPYFLGISLKGTMTKKFTDSDRKQILKKGQSVLYKADGTYKILDYPTAYINNMYYIKNKYL
jgi:hypothetical protein